MAKEFKIKLTAVRLSFPQLFKPKAFEDGGEVSYGAAFILDKTKHAGLIKEFRAMVKEIASEYFKGKIPPMVAQKHPLRDGSEKEDRDGYGDGVMFIGSRNKKRPTVVDRDLSPLAEEDGKPYAGCYVNATLRLWVQDNKFGKRVNCQLRAVQFVKDGEPFGQAPVDANEEFDSLDGDDDSDDGDDLLG
jgi:hypothetical protein